MSGVIAHVANPTAGDAVALATAAESGGARWIGFADAFWWRDVWMLLSGVAAVTSRIEIGPAMTNPYLRHPFHTMSALATLHEQAPGRVFCGVAAGGSEVEVAARIPRRDAAERVTNFVELIGSVAEGAPLDEPSGRDLQIPLPLTPVLVAGRGNKMLATAGAVADRVLLWAIPLTDLDRSVGVIRASAAAAGRSPELIWAPLVRHRDVSATSLGHPAVYAALNTAASIRQGWGLDAPTVDAIRSALVGGRLTDAIDLVSPAAMRDLVLDPGDTTAIASKARELGVSELAVPGFSSASLQSHLAWADAVESQL